jgi:diguanylate cyclase (GGDEF)-like protein
MVALLLGSLYSIIRISYSPSTLYSVLISFSDLFSFFVVALMFFYIINIKQMDELVEQNKKFGLFLIDCSDLISINMKLGVEGGNQLLIKIAHSLKEVFKDALILARYGGDEFALVVKIGEEQITVSQVVIKTTCEN